MVRTKKTTFSGDEVSVPDRLQPAPIYLQALLARLLSVWLLNARLSQVCGWRARLHPNRPCLMLFMWQMHAEWTNVWQMNAEWTNVWQIHNAEWTMCDRWMLNEQVCDRWMLNKQMWVSTSHRFSTKRWMLLKGFELCEIFRLKGVKHHRKPVHENIRGKKCWFPCPFIAIFQQFELGGGGGGETRAHSIHCNKVEARQVFIDTLSWEEHKPFRAASGFLGWLCPIKMTYRRFSVPQSQFKNCCQFQLTTSRNCLPPEDGFRLLVSSNPLLRFRLVISRDLAILGKSSFRIWPFPVSRLPEMLGWEEWCGWY